MKPIHARWLISFYDHMQNQVNLIKQSFHMAGIYDAITMLLPEEDPFIDLIKHNMILSLISLPIPYAVYAVNLMFIL